MKTFVSLTALFCALITATHAVEKPLGTFSSSGATMTSIYSNANLRGVLVRASWSQIEPTPGTFSFTAIDNQVAGITSRGKSWSLAVLGGGVGCPAWLTDPAASGGLGAPYVDYAFRGAPGYRLPLFWDATVQTRLTLLANALAARYNTDASLKLVYITQMTANGVEGHLQGVTMSTLIAAGNDQDGDSDVDAADFALHWIAASKAASRSFALAFTNKPLAFEVHDVNGSSTIPETIINDLWNDASLNHRVGAAMWWISGKTTYQTQLINVLSAYPGDIYGQVIGKSGEGAWAAGTPYAAGAMRMPVNPPAAQRYRYEATTAGTSGGTEPVWPTTINATVTDGSVVWTCRDSQFGNGDFTTVFSQAKAVGMRYIEPWEWEFNNTTSSANGEWNTAMQDFNAWADATFGGGNTAPTITGIPDPTTGMGTAVGPLSFTIGDAESDAASLSLTASSSNTTLLPLANITFGGSGANRTITLSPAAGQNGTSTVTVIVSDGTLTAQTLFTLTVSAGNTAPTVSTIPNQTTTSGVAVGPIAFTIGDAETAAAALSVFRNSSSTTLVPAANIVLGGSGANRTVTVTPAAGQTGTANIILIVSDGLLQTVRIFTLTVNAGGNTAPTITGIPGQFTTPGTAAGPLSFTVGDAQTAAASLIVTCASSNTTLLPNANIVLGGGGANRTITLTPASGQAGSTTVTLTVSDGSLTAEASFSLVVSSSPQTVTALTALHQNGQTYLTWNEVADSTATYRIYRSTTPFTSTAQLVAADLVGTAGAGSSLDARLSGLRSTSYFYRITAAGPDLSGTQGLFVHTAASDGEAFYAATAVVGGVEQIALDPGQNTTDAVNEVVAMPEPVLQRTLTINGRGVEVYVHWTSASATALYPAMGNQSSTAHHFGLVRNGSADTHSLLIRPHARQGSFLSTVTGTNDANEWVLTLDDWMPNSIENTFWHGYHEGFSIETGGPQGTGGTVHDYTTRRVKWEVEWAMRTLPLDLNRLYMTGHSMGGIGSHFLSLMLPGKIAAVWTTSAKYDFSFLNDPNPANIWNDGSNERATSGDLMWGTVATGLMSSGGLPVYDRLNAGYLASAFRSVDQPVMIAYHGRNDVVVGWAEKIGFYNAMNASRHGGRFFFDSGVHNRSGGEWLVSQDMNVLNRYRLNQSYPAFSSSSANGSPGTGAAASGDTFGTINGNLDWDTGTIIDTATQWQVRLSTSSLMHSTGTIAAPANATAAVTPRRLQAFPHTPGALARYEVHDLGNVLLQSGLISADADGLFTVPAVSITSTGTTLTLLSIPTAAPAATVTPGGISLQWATVPGVRYQLEWSSDMTIWLQAGEARTAASASMSWEDAGGLTGGESRRFYRLRIGD
ncbi:MAG: hypothetical protein CJBNEKGG_04381 [Prosthecobacter sp.]|nr:hypothetical protein [Prosthecobacter sp.]